jgi:acetyl-CoA C-acetyltransferase
MVSHDDVDPRTPVLIGVGQVSERLGEPDYRRRSPVLLGAEAAREALVDTGADADSVAAALDTVAGVRQFEVSTALSHAPLGRSDNYPRSVARRIGADPARAVLEVTGGQSPQHLVTEFAAAIAAGDAEVVLVVGAEAISTARASTAATTHRATGASTATDSTDSTGSTCGGERPDWSERVDGQLEDRGYGLAGMATRQQIDHGVSVPAVQYALCENARRARLKQSRDEYAAGMGELFAPFTAVAAANPHAAAPVERTAAELATPSERNRMVADPYPRYLVSRDQVNQGAAVLLASVAAARRLGVPPERWVFLHGHADTVEQPLLDRGSGPASVEAARAALDEAGIGVDQLAAIDLYSCFPVAVAHVAEGMGLVGTPGRPLTLTGGLPFFGGPGNNYATHAIAEVVRRCRAAPGTFGFVGANGGVLSKYSAGIYSTTPVGWRRGRSAALQAELDERPVVAQARHADGWATVETCTVHHRRGGDTGIVVGRLDADGRRFLATAADGDDELLALLRGDLREGGPDSAAGEPLGARVYVRSFGRGNRVTLTRDRMDALFLPRTPGLRERYEHVLVRRDGHLLEVTINRRDARNALHPPANDELDEIFDAYFADPDLWVAILTGAGERAFSAGNDLAWTASGKPMWVPKNGFAGLTGRAGMTKPVIAAVNGYAMGGGCEIALACHLVVADETARFALSEVRVGLAAAAGGLVRLPRAVPPAVAREMVLTGRRLSAVEALGYGLVNRVTGAGEALTGARTLAAEVLAGSPTSVRASLRMMAETDGIADTVAAVNHPSPALDELLLSADLVEGLTAFTQKRPPVWRNH